MKAHPIIGAHADCGRYWPRTQREAGLEFKVWSDRLKPLRPWSKDILNLAGMVALVAILWFACSLMAA